MSVGKSSGCCVTMASRTAYKACSAHTQEQQAHVKSQLNMQAHANYIHSIHSMLTLDTTHSGLVPPRRLRTGPASTRTQWLHFGHMRPLGHSASQQSHPFMLGIALKGAALNSLWPMLITMPCKMSSNGICAELCTELIHNYSVCKTVQKPSAMH